MTIWIILGVVLLLVIAAVAYFATQKSSDDRRTGPRGQGRGRRGASHVGGPGSERDSSRQDSSGQTTHRSHSETTRETPRVQSPDQGDQGHSDHSGQPNQRPRHEQGEPQMHRGDASEVGDDDRR